ncbi:hypothetical protein LguiA_013284 [Lonicera macranthoides]
MLASSKTMLRNGLVCFVWRAQSAKLTAQHSASRYFFEDANFDKAFLMSLRVVCPTSDHNNDVAALDELNLNKFDKAYFQDLMVHYALLHSNHKLFNGSPMDELVRLCAMNESLLKENLVAALIKLGSLI